MQNSWYIVTGKGCQSTYVSEDLLKQTMMTRFSEPDDETPRKTNVVKIKPSKLDDWGILFDPERWKKRTGLKATTEDTDRELETLVAELRDYLKVTDGTIEDDFAKLVEYEIIGMRGSSLRQVSKAVNAAIDNVAFELGNLDLQKCSTDIIKRAKRHVVRLGLEKALKGHFKTHALDIPEDNGNVALLPLVDSESEVPAMISESVVRSEEPGEESAVLVWNMESKYTVFCSAMIYKSY